MLKLDEVETFHDFQKHLIRIMKKLSEEEGKTLNETIKEWYDLINETLTFLNGTKKSEEDLKELKKLLEEKLFEVEQHLSSLLWM